MSWKKESKRHSLAACGIKTRSRSSTTQKSLKKPELIKEYPFEGIPKVNPPYGSRRGYIGHYQPYDGAAIEEHYGYSVDDICESIHRTHGSMDIHRLKISPGSHMDVSGSGVPYFKLSDDDYMY